MSLGEKKTFRKLVPIERPSVNKAPAMDQLGVRLLRALLVRMENLRSQDPNLGKVEAWDQVLATDEGQRFLEIIGKNKTNEAALLEKLDKMGKDLEEIKRKRRNHMYKSIGEIAEAIEKGDLKSQRDVLKVLDELRDRDISKSEFSKSKERAIYDQCTHPAWPSLYNRFTNLPETIEQGEVIEKRAKQSELIVKTIKVMAEKLVQKEGMTKEKAFIAILDRNPLLEATYRKFY